MIKKCVICGRAFDCSPSRNIVTCGPECRAEYSLRNWLRENGKYLFGVDPDTKQFDNVIYGLSRAKKSVLGTLPPGQRPCYTYKGWKVIPIKK